MFVYLLVPSWQQAQAQLLKGDNVILTQGIQALGLCREARPLRSYCTATSPAREDEMLMAASWTLPENPQISLTLIRPNIGKYRLASPWSVGSCTRCSYTGGAAHAPPAHTWCPRQTCSTSSTLTAVREDKGEYLLKMNKVSPSSELTNTPHFASVTSCFFSIIL